MAILLPGRKGPPCIAKERRVGSCSAETQRTARPERRYMVYIVIHVGETSLLISLVSIVSPICKDRKGRVLARSSYQQKKKKE